MLYGDVSACEAVITAADSPFSRRQLVRAVFALIEAGTYSVKKIVAAAHTDGDFDQRAVKGPYSGGEFRSRQSRHDHQSALTNPDRA